MNLARRIATVLLWLVVAAHAASAHEVRPAFLQLRETAPNEFQMTWKVPALGAFRLSMAPRLPEFCRAVGDPVLVWASGAAVEHRKIACAESLTGHQIRIDGLAATMTDVLVRIESADGHVQGARLTPSSPSFGVEGVPGALSVLRAYIGLGVEHILFGVDHLLFVLCLLLLVRSVRSLLATITAFTLAHSITLALATLDIIRVPAPPVEATIALSIVFLATELARGEAGRGVATTAYPWLVAFSFGLLHGLGFAGALAEVGLPQGEVPLALFAFNIGVELGQVAFVTAVLSAGWLLRTLAIRMPSWAPRAAAYAIGSTASFWVFARLGAVG